MDQTPTPRGPGRRTGIVTAAACAFFALFFIAPTLLAQDSQGQQGGKDSQYYFSIMENVFSFIQDNYVDPVESKVLYEGAMKGMFEALKDPYSLYMDEAMTSDLNDTTSGKFGGVGLYISKEEADASNPNGPRYIEVVSPIEDTPGWRAGILPSDLIVKIGDESTADMTTDDAVSKLRGDPESTVTITLRRGQAEFPETIRRANIEVPNYKKAILPDGKGYLRIIEFTPQTPARVREALQEFVKAKCPAIIIDLRNNPGGLLASVVQIADYFLDSGPIVTTKARNAVDNYTYSAKSDLIVPKSIPVVVLINQGSASASEILSGALKDQKRAYLIGENTFGKGSVQQPYNLGKTGFKLTTSRYYTPSDANIDKTGIPPDLEVKTPELNAEQTKQIEDLLTKGTVRAWADAHQGATKADISAWVQSLGLKGFSGLEWVVEAMARDEINRRNIAPVYDLDYDSALRAALTFLDTTKDVQAAINATKTVRQIQDERKAAGLPSGASSPPSATPSPAGLPLPAVSPNP